MRYFLHLGYNGSRYHGWQNQPNVQSVQEVLEQNLSLLLRKKTTCHGCGRTDAKVHASQYFAHFDFENKLDTHFVFQFNKMLPDDIAVFEIISVPEKANAQLDAIKRTYDYFIHFNKDPFLNDFSSLYHFEELDFDKMKKAASLFTDYQDYKNFCLSPQTHKSTICQITEANLFLTKNGDRMRFQIASNRFLKGMIRTIVGRLLEVGKGKLNILDLKNALKGDQALPFNKIAYPQGLYLSKIKYPYLDVQTKSEFSKMLVNQLNNDWQTV